LILVVNVKRMNLQGLFVRTFKTLNQKVTDISLPYKEPMRGFSVESSHTLDKEGWNASMINLYTHAGTHMDAPLHFGINNKGIDTIDPERLISPCHIVRYPCNEGSVIIGLESVRHLEKNIRQGESILFHTGWSHYTDDPDMYRNKLPRISEKLARWMVKKKVNLIGVEPPSIADVNNLDELKLIHRILLEAGILILEGLTNLESVSRDYGMLVALPLKIHAGDGAPARAVIFEHL